MAIAYSNKTGYTFTNSTSATQAHTISGSNSLLVVTVGTLNNVTVTATYNDVSMKKAVEARNASGAYSTIFYLVNPDTGNNNIQVNFSGTPNGTFGGVSFTGVDQVNPIDATATTTGTAQNKSLNITTNYNNSFLIDSCNASTGNHTVGAGQTAAYTTMDNRASSYKQAVTSGVNNMSYTATASGTYGFCIVAIREHISINGNILYF